MHYIKCYTGSPAYIASATKTHVNTIFVASPAACGPLSPSYNVEAKRITLLPRSNRLQVQHCIRGRGPQISYHSSFLSESCPLVFCSALAIFRASTIYWFYPINLILFLLLKIIINIIYHFKNKKINIIEITLINKQILILLHDFIKSE